MHFIYLYVYVDIVLLIAAEDRVHNLFVSTSLVPGLQVYATTPGFVLLCFN